MPRGTAQLKSPVGVSIAVCVLLGVVIATDLFALWTGYQERSVAAAFAAGHYSAWSERDAGRVDALYAEAGRVQLLALVATAAVFIVWFRRVRINAEVFRPDGHTRSRGWASWGWFVPIMNFFVPRQVAIDTWNASERETGLMREKSAHAVINCWWTLWLVGTLFSRLVGQRFRDAEQFDEIKSATEMTMVSDALDIAAAVAAIVFVRALTRMQNEKALHGPSPLGGMA